MYIEFGHLLLILTLVIISFQIYQFVPLYVNKSFDTSNVFLTTYLVSFQFIMITIAFSSIFYSYIISDFSIINVIENSHSTQPLLYKISGVWGNHEGSILLWCWVLSLYSFILCLFINKLPSRVYVASISIQSIILGFFLTFTLLTSNPFLKVLFFIPNGTELNPILQDPGLIIHPPLIYFGYLGFSVPFSLAIASLLEEIVNKDINTLIRLFTLISWSFLTLGITLGSWWAYYELGWGGWWFWDPVENASLMPWLAGTSLLHSVIIASKRGLLQKLTFVLSILTFLFSLIGTFFVRSGLLSSVHSFANDSARGLLIFGFFLFTLLASVSIYVIKIKRFELKELNNYFTNEGTIVLQNILLMAICFTVCIGTFAPVVFSYTVNRSISIGFPFYNYTIVPLVVPILILMAINPFLKPQLVNIKTNSKIFKQSFKYFISFYTPIGLSIILYLTLLDNTTPLVGYIFILFSSLLFISTIFNSIQLSSIRNKSMLISHLGVGIFIIAVTVSSLWQTESIQLLRPGDQVQLANYIYTFLGINNIEGPNYYSMYGNFQILDQYGEFLTSLLPEKRFYSVQGIYSTKAAIHTNWFTDLYAIIGDGNLSHGWYTRFFHNPLMPYVWLSGVVVTIGGLLSIINVIRNRK